jgi:predicted MPP superfamily phosphohydrolase
MSLTRRDALKGVMATAVGAVTGATVYGLGYERHALRLTESKLPVAGLPPALDGLRIGFLTDIHHSEMVSADDVQQAVTMASRARPDLIVLGGDYVTWGDRTYVGPVAELLGSLRAPHGVFAILGNHDDDRDMPAALTAQHMAVLRDARTSITVLGEALNLVGIRFWTRRAEDIARLTGSARGTVLLLAHDPRRLVEAASLGIPGILSGHTHGGQVVIPGFGALARRNFPVVAGLASQGRTSIFVSRGIGTVYVPVRINCPPEVAIVTLRRDVGGQPA